MPSLRRQCLARFYRYLMAGFEVTINGRFWVTAEVPIPPHRLDPAKEAQPLVMLTGGGHGGLAPAHRPPPGQLGMNRKADLVGKDQKGFLFLL